MDFKKFYMSPARYDAPGFKCAYNEVQPIFLSGAPAHFNSTRFFAWYGIPKYRYPVPGIVLLHGKSGSAFAPWVKYWNDRGFAAIAIDLFGGVPNADGEYAVIEPPRRHGYSGPGPDQRYQEVDLPPEEQWPYHAVAAAITATSFLSEMPGVNPDQLGATGISRGGFIAALAAGFEPRWKFVMPIYGCGGFNFPDDLAESDRAKFNELWNPENFLAQASMPLLWINGACDHSFDVKNWEKSAAAAPRSYRSLRQRMAHSQEYAAALPVLPQFAQAALQHQEWPHFTQVEVDAAKLTITGHFVSNCPIVKAEVIWTRASGCWNDCVFRAESAQLDTASGTVTGKLPARYQASYLALHDEKGRLHTSKVCFRD